ncbi:EVE domain-containing protein [Nostoc sp. FACHB-87]|uniref:EVE domain-containing protein n=1 Tax=Nostocaceae TaxID=1162 RepID=UPI0016870756|nr:MULTISPECIES: EVE domain-containing protein [Nostocaceae]MBD2457288.1 EVE domain-containing protein [Nostoc sp. FACHB-87]MBD2478357.1 EVE domain-containing protein [Anabaena sp. FACHB-83]
MTYWLFQGNPKYYRIIDSIRDFEQMPWLATRYAKEMAAGDGVLIWKSGEQSGIYAIAEITEPPKIIASPPDIGYWIDTSRVGIKPCARIRFTSKLLEKPLLRENLKQDLVLKNLIVIRQPNATNYKITQQEWQRVHELKGN